MIYLSLLLFVLQYCLFLFTTLWDVIIIFFFLGFNSYSISDTILLILKNIFPFFAAYFLVKDYNIF